MKQRGAWINTSIKDLNISLPRKLFSLQFIVVLCLMPLISVIYQLCHHSISLIPQANDYKKVYLAVYVAQLVVLHHMAKSRGYFYPKNPVLIIYPRTLISMAICVVLPIIIGALIYLDMQALENGPNSLYMVLMMALPFPLYCTNSLLLLARRYDWASREEHPEVYNQETWCWKFFVILIVGCVLSIGYFSWRMGIDSDEKVSHFQRCKSQPSSMGTIQCC